MFGLSTPCNITNFGNQKLILVIKRTDFGNQETNLRNQTDKFWKSKVSFEKSNGQILETKSVISEIKRDKFKNKMTQ